MANKKNKVSAKNLEELSYMDVVFIIDVTGSMAPYIEEAKRKAAEILRTIRDSGNLDIRVGLIVYRDHPPQDPSFVTKKYDLNTIENFDGWLGEQFASGGGDIPEAVYDGVNDLFSLEWRDNSDRVVYLIGDAPPHTKEVDYACPCGLTSKQLIENLKKFGIELNAHSIAGAAAATREFKILVDATGGVITTGDRPEHGTEMYHGSMLVHSTMAGNSKSFINSYVTNTGTYDGAASVNMSAAYAAGEEAGLNADEVERTVSYLKKRNL